MSPSILLHANFDTDCDDQFHSVQLPAEFAQDEYKSTRQSPRGYVFTCADNLSEIIVYYIALDTKLCNMNIVAIPTPKHNSQRLYLSVHSGPLNVKRQNISSSSLGMDVICPDK